MRICVQRLYLPDCDVGINLRRDDRGVTEQLLNHANIGAAFEHRDSRRMPKRVRVDPLVDASASRPFLDCAGYRARFNPPIPHAQEYRLGAFGFLSPVPSVGARVDHERIKRRWPIGERRILFPLPVKAGAAQPDPLSTFDPLSTLSTPHREKSFCSF